MIRTSPQAYFETETIQENGTDYTPLLIFGGICLVAIVAIAYKK